MTEGPESRGEREAGRWTLGKAGGEGQRITGSS